MQCCLLGLVWGMTNHLKEWIGKGLWFLSTSLFDAMIDMVVGGIYSMNSLCILRI